MAIKTLQTRIQSKVDTYQNWMASDLVLLNGEIALCTIPVSAENSGSVNLPSVMMRVGDGAHKFSELPWFQACSANSYAWSLAPEKPQYDASEITGLADFIDKTVTDDSNTIFQIVKVDDYTYKLQSQEKNATTWADVSTLTIPNKTADIEALQALVGETSVATQITNAINALDATAVTAGTGKVIDSVSQTNGVVSATTRSLVKGDIPTIDQSQVDGLATALAGKQATVSFDGTYDATKNRAATVSTVTTAIGNLNKADTAVAKKLVSAVRESNGIIEVERRELVAADIPTIAQSQVDGLADSLAAKQDVLGFEGEYNKSSNKVITKSYLDTMIADLNGAMHFEGVVTGTTFADAVKGTAYAAGDVVLYGVDEYVYDGSEWHVLGNEAIYQLKSDAETQHNTLKEELTTEINKKQNTLTFDGTYNANTNAAATVSTVTNAVNALDKSDSAVATQLVSAVSQSNGVINVSRRALVAADIPTLEQSKINGLTTALASKQDNLSFDGTYNASSNPAATKKTVTDAVAGLKNEDAAVAGKFVTEVKQSNGIVVIQRAQVQASQVQGLAAVATSGSIADISQPEGLTLVLNCGSSTVNI